MFDDVDLNRNENGGSIQISNLPMRSLGNARGESHDPKC